MEYIESWGVLIPDIFYWFRSGGRGRGMSVTAKFVKYVAWRRYGAIIGGIVIRIVSRRVTTQILHELTDISNEWQILILKPLQRRKQNEIGHSRREYQSHVRYVLEKAYFRVENGEQRASKKDIEKKQKIDQMRRDFCRTFPYDKNADRTHSGLCGDLEDVNSDPERPEILLADVIGDESGEDETTWSKADAQPARSATTLFRWSALISRHCAQLLPVRRSFCEAERHFVHMDQTKRPSSSDEFKIEEVLMNYFSNAVNHCEKEKGCRGKDRGNGRACQSFGVQYRYADRSDSCRIWGEVYKGGQENEGIRRSGIGLSIVKAIMESMNQKYGVINYEKRR